MKTRPVSCNTSVVVKKIFQENNIQLVTLMCIVEFEEFYDV